MDHDAGAARGQRFPGQFGQHVRSGSLPHVSWIIPPLGFDEHENDESGGYGPSIPTTQRMPNQKGGTDQARTYFTLTREERRGRRTGRGSRLRRHCVKRRPRVMTALALRSPRPAHSPGAS